MCVLRSSTLHLGVAPVTLSDQSVCLSGRDYHWHGVCMFPLPLFVKARTLILWLFQVSLKTDICLAVTVKTSGHLAFADGKWDIIVWRRSICSHVIWSMKYLPLFNLCSWISQLNKLAPIKTSAWVLLEPRETAANIPLALRQPVCYEMLAHFKNPSHIIQFMKLCFIKTVVWVL